MIKSHQNTTHRIDHADQLLVDAIENHVMQLSEFTHQNHVKLAYCYLVQFGLSASSKIITRSLKSFLKAKGVDANKFHVTLTEAWLKAVWYFMQLSPACQSSESFLENSPMLLNKDLLLSHYSHELLFSECARKHYVEPDLSAFPIAFH